MEALIELFKLVTEWLLLLATCALMYVTIFDIAPEQRRTMAQQARHVPVIGRLARVTVTETQTVTVQED